MFLPDRAAIYLNVMGQNNESRLGTMGDVLRRSIQSRLFNRDSPYIILGIQAIYSGSEFGGGIYIQGIQVRAQDLQSDPGRFLHFGRGYRTVLRNLLWILSNRPTWYKSVSGTTPRKYQNTGKIRGSTQTIRRNEFAARKFERVSQILR